MLRALILVAAIAWVIGQLWATRQKLHRGDVVIPPLFATTLLFALFIIVLLAIGASPLHLLWLFPLSFVAGVILVTIPAGANFTMACLGLLASLKPDHKP
jgi:hypothetical protein